MPARQTRQARQATQARRAPHLAAVAAAALAFGPAHAEDAGDATPLAVAVADGALAFAAPRPASPVKGPVAPAVPAEARGLPVAYVPVPEAGPGLLVGRDAWLAEKFDTDPFLFADPGLPTVRFAPAGPALR